MNDNHHNHHEDPTICYRVGLFFIAVLAIITIIGMAN